MAKWKLHYRQTQETIEAAIVIFPDDNNGFVVFSNSSRAEDVVFALPAKDVRWIERLEDQPAGA